MGCRSAMGECKFELPADPVTERCRELLAIGSENTGIAGGLVEIVGGGPENTATGAGLGDEVNALVDIDVAGINSGGLRAVEIEVAADVEVDATAWP